MNAIPKHQDFPSTWKGVELAKHPATWTLQLSPTVTEQLIEAARHFLDARGSVELITKEDFDGDALHEITESIREQLLQGVGFVLVKGLDNHHSREIQEIIFTAIGAHLGNARPQNAKGDLLGHVRDAGKDSHDPNVRIYQTNERQHFHTDSADVVGLLCLQPALEGGQSLLVSAETVFNEIREQRPDLLSLLMQPIATDRRGEIPPGMKPFTLIPVFSYHQQRLTVYYQRQYIESAQRFPEAPRLTDQHCEALDLFDQLCNDPNLHLTMQLDCGDMQFVYNHALLHDRTAFKDDPDSSKRRYLRRLWLSIPEDRELPPIFAERYGTIKQGQRGGIYTE